jgi:hypothetical protein
MAQLGRAREEQILGAYAEWDGTGSVEEFVTGLGVSKQTLYSVLRRNGVPTKTQEQTLRGMSVPDKTSQDAMIDRMAELALVELMRRAERCIVVEADNRRLRQLCIDNSVDPGPELAFENGGV